MGEDMTEDEEKTGEGGGGVAVDSVDADTDEDADADVEDECALSVADDDGACDLVFWAGVDVNAEDKAIGDGEQFFKLAARQGAGPITCSSKQGHKRL